MTQGNHNRAVAWPDMKSCNAHHVDHSDDVAAESSDKECLRKLRMLQYADDTLTLDKLRAMWNDIGNDETSAESSDKDVRLAIQENPARKFADVV